MKRGGAVRPIAPHDGPMPTAPAQRLQPNLSRISGRAQRALDGGDRERAHRLFGLVLRSHPQNFEALHGLGRLHCEAGRLDSAVALFQAALAADCRRSEGFASLGLAFYLLRRFELALQSYEAGLRLAPHDAGLHNGRGVALLELGQAEEALHSFDRAVSLDSCCLDALGNRANALLKLNRPADAVDAYDAALALAPGNAALLTNRAVALRRLDRPHEAVMNAREALAGRPDFAPAQFVESIARLSMGDFAVGWPAYEARWSVGALARRRRDFAAPLWRGDAPLGGKTILLHAEQGFGDTIQFARYAPLVARRGAARVILEVQPQLMRLFSAWPTITVIAHGAPLPPFDCHCPLMSLPLVFGTKLDTIPADVPYVAPPGAEILRWAARLPSQRALIGLVWSGERSHDNDLNRSLPLRALLPLLDDDDFSFVSLQHEVRGADAGLLRDHPNIMPLGEEFGDFADAAAAISGLDLVISVDTAVAHLAGAMAKPLWLLLPFGADFRWLRERDDSPWYPSARLFRQPRFGDWGNVIDRVRDTLVRSHHWLRRPAAWRERICSQH